MPRQPRHSGQGELFPAPIEIVRVDPRERLGAHTRVHAVYRVRYGAEMRVHAVFHDRHGWYCEEHGAGCAAVRHVRASLAER